MRSNRRILVFGCGELQKSIIGRAHRMGLYVVGIDPCEEAFCKDDADAFEVVGGQDYDRTCAVVEKYGINAIVTAATDKPLVMMARIAEKYGFPFFSVDTAIWSTDKYQMKNRFKLGGIPCADGRLVSCIEEAEGLVFPLIVKPRDNSGSRGVKLCRNTGELKTSIEEALENSRLDTVLVEEYIEGQEYSIEGLHYDGESEVVQFTEKTTTEFPYNVELEHKQPANLTDEQKDSVREIVCKISAAMKFNNCPSHTELKINERGIFVIETSPRLGGDYITSILTPLSTGINLEDQLLHIALGESVDTITGRSDKASAVHFFCLPEGTVVNIDDRGLEEAKQWPGIYSLNLKLKEGDNVHQITSSLNRYGEFIVKAEDRKELDGLLSEYEKETGRIIHVK